MKERDIAILPVAGMLRLVRFLLLLCSMFALAQHQVYAASADWLIKIKASVGESHSKITFGEFADATDGYDIKYDAPAHTAAATVVAYFEHPEWGLSDTNFWYDIKSAGHTRQWTFYTDSDMDGQELTLEWYFSNVPAGYQITLSDSVSGQSVDMMTETSYSYVSGALRQFTITAVLPDPPVLLITSHVDAVVVNSAAITLAGTASDAGRGDSGVASVTVNGQPTVGGTATGTNVAHWSFATTLNEGTNVFSVNAKDGSVYQDQVSKSITVIYTPANNDTDNDGLPDDWEMTHFGNLVDASATTDNDGDGLDNGGEYVHGSDPNNNDSDGDGIADGIEVALGINPANSDSDGDGDSDSDELRYGSDPLSSSDTINSHRPYQPLVQPIYAAATLEGQIFDSSEFDDADILKGDYLTASHWQISSSQTFASAAIVLERQLLRSDAADQASNTHRRLLLSKGVLQKGRQYWIRTRHQDRAGLWSDWSQGMVFSTVDNDPNDLLGDGIDDRYQVSGYSDSNNNGIDDNSETGLSVIHSAGLNHVIGITANNGSLAYLTVMDVADSADQASVATMPYHLFDFRIDGLPVDSANPASVALTFHFPDALPAGAKWYKFDVATQTLTDFSAHAIIDGRQVTLTLTDGGEGDADGVVNGVIIDPSGPWIAAQDSSGAGQDTNPPVIENGDSQQVSMSSGGGRGLFEPLFLLFWPLALWLRRSRA